MMCGLSLSARLDQQPPPPFSPTPHTHPRPHPPSTTPILSSSLAVDFGLPSPTPYPNAVALLPPLFEAHQHLLVTSVWMRERVQCSNAEVGLWV